MLVLLAVFALLFIVNFVIMAISIVILEFVYDKFLRSKFGITDFKKGLICCAVSSFFIALLDFFTAGIMNLILSGIIMYSVFRSPFEYSIDKRRIAVLVVTGVFVNIGVGMLLASLNLLE